MTKITLELSEGDWIVHNRHGLGQITGMDTKELLGDRKVFYVVKTDSITYWLPIAESASERIRPVSTSKAFEEAINILEQTPKPLEENFRRRLAYIQEKLQDSNLLVKAALIRDMYARDVQKDVHINEKKILDTLQKQFINEWIAACEIDQDEAEAVLRKSLKKSIAQLELK
jgi:CarD family transcriptional regulator